MRPRNMTLPRSIVFAHEALERSDDLQRIIDEALLASPSGCTICLPSGVVYLDAPLRIGPTTSILGDPNCPRPASVICPSPSFSGEALITMTQQGASGSSNPYVSTAVSRIANLELRGAMTIDVADSRHIKLNNVHFNFNDTALDILQAPELSIRDCFFQTDSSGVAVRVSRITSMTMAYSTFALAPDAYAMHVVGITSTASKPIISFARNAIVPYPAASYLPRIERDLVTFESCFTASGASAIVAAFGNYVQAERPVCTEAALCESGGNISAAYVPDTATQTYSVQGTSVTAVRTGASQQALRTAAHVFSLSDWTIQQKFIRNDQLNSINTDNHKDPTKIMIYNLVTDRPTYTIKSPIWIRGPSVLRGKGQSVTYMKLGTYPDVLKEVALVNIATEHPVAVSGVTFNGAVEPDAYGTSDNRVPCILGVSGGASVRIRSCSFKQSKDACVAAESSSIHFERCSFADCRACISLVRCRHSSIMNCNLFGFSECGVRLYSSDAMACCGCVVGDSEELMSELAPHGRQIGVAYAGDSAACIISDNVFANVHAAVAPLPNRPGVLRASCLTNNCVVTPRFWSSLPRTYDADPEDNVIENNTHLDGAGNISLDSAV